MIALLFLALASAALAVGSRAQLASRALAFSNLPAASRPLAPSNQRQTIEATAPQPQAAAVSPSPQTSPLLQPHLTYGVLFRVVVAFKKQAELREQQGLSGLALRTHFSRQAGLNETEAQALTRIAEGSGPAIAALDQAAKLIIDAARARHPGGRLLLGETLPAPPPQLGELEQQRKTAILQAREQLRLALGDEAFRRFDEFVQQDFARRIRPVQPGLSPAATTKP
ncbi:MAG: hypothetical protein ACR2GW_13375 [Pyrinomonadaceae bacterium]